MKEEWSQNLACALPVIYNKSVDDDPSKTGIIIIQIQLVTT